MLGTEGKGNVNMDVYSTLSW